MPRPVMSGATVRGRSLVGEMGCGQCPHFGSRTGPYRCWTGPDSLCFRGSPVFAGAGMRFESHLGHSVSAGQRPFWVSDRVYTPCPMWLGLVSSPRYMRLWLAFLWPVPFFLSATFSPCYSFIAGPGGGNMTCFGPGEWGRGGLLSVSWSDGPQSSLPLPPGEAVLAGSGHRPGHPPL